MRDVPALMTQAWQSGDYTGRNRPMARVTVQPTRNILHHFGPQTYASVVFGSDIPPKELPNVRSVRWSRNIDTDTSGCSITLANVFGEDPGYYTYNRGQGELSQRWDHVPNEWQGLLMPDNTIRVYEGYGFDPDVPPESDPHLVQTGVWLIDDVQLDSEGGIQLELRDLGRLLTDHIAFPPVVPDDFYPLQFEAIAKQSGFYAAVFERDEQADWEGPLDPPVLTGITHDDGLVSISWDPPPEILPETPLPPAFQGGQAYSSTGRGYWLHMPDGDRWYHVTGEGQLAGVAYLYGPYIHVPDENIGVETDTVSNFFGGAGMIEHYLPRYEVVGYRLYLDNVLMPNPLSAQATSATIRRLMNGNVYFAEAAAIYQELNTGRRQVGDRSTPEFAYPNSGGPAATPFGLTVNDPDGLTEVPGWLRWSYESVGGVVDWTILIYRGQELVQLTHQTNEPAGTATVTFQTGRGDLRPWNVLVFGNQAGVGRGVVALRSDGGDGELYGLPVAGEPPPEPPPARGRPAATTRPGEHHGLHTREIVLIPWDSSTRVRTGDYNSSVHGHRAADAFDARPETYWLSPGNARTTDWEWVEGALGGEQLVKVRLHAFGHGYVAYVSVQANGRWVQFQDHAQIPYDARVLDNGARIPYVAITVFPGNEGPIDIVMPRPIPGAERIRVTMTNLRGDLGPAGNRAALRKINAYVEGPGTHGEVSTQRLEAFIPQPVRDLTNSRLRGPRVIGGAGDHPGAYEDYTDIVKLLCAWAGFFWPQRGRVYASDGTFEEHDFGRAPYNLGDNIDPVLGARGGRVWGDFEVSGVAGVVPLPVSLFDKKPLIDGINHVREILGFILHVDEEGAVVFRSPNIFEVGNWVLVRSENAGRTQEIVTIDERVTLIGLRPLVTSRNVRESVFVGNADGSLAATSRGFNPNPTGLRRVGGWTDQNFGSQEECQLMADMISLRQLFTYRSDSVTIPGYPKVQINDQIRIVERVTSESYLHFVKGISSSMDLDSGEWTYDVETHWLGERPSGVWAFDPSELHEVTRNYLQIMGRLSQSENRFPVGLTSAHRSETGAHVFEEAP